jgi:hypothetical protein
MLGAQYVSQATCIFAGHELILSFDYYEPYTAAPEIATQRGDFLLNELSLVSGLVERKFS